MTRAACVTPSAVTAKALTAYNARRRRWLADSANADTDSLVVGLAPPSEATVAADPDAVVAWTRDWRAHAGAGLVEWETRRWPSFGSQEIPVRVSFHGAGQIAAAAGRGAQWRRLSDRRDRLVSGIAPAAPDLPAAVSSTATTWESFDDNDFDRLIDVLRWLLTNPPSGMFIRQLPVPGVDTKWISRHRRVIETLVAGVRGDGGLGVRTAPRMHELAVLDRCLLPGGPRVFAAAVDELGALPLQPARVLILENKEGLHALPDMPGTVALHGGGYTVHELAALPWLTGPDVWYWGDLDSHGFAILDRLRHHLPAVRSLLMDCETLHRWRELAVTDPSPAPGTFGLLTAGETAALEALRAGELRLEQERIPWPYALEQLRQAWTVPN
ncbi:DUF3322 domain-containing protein [Rhodococcus sp. AG1013]|uniref:DUF3322 domain-containing protein n=1 Tax=unclassified Rhodococcus (in: high G+C Gram-positive bacteria) TaxID=192944 RepID=UPI000E0A76A6|nr:DUF3322 domain-containing protein [Rhodococcus sp. AG1013]RDI24058.1 hypothetical protein DEU38_111135 [Rhodococcus sp. AG1013]